MARKINVKEHIRDGSKVEAHTREISSKPASSGAKPPSLDLGTNTSNLNSKTKINKTKSNRNKTLKIIIDDEIESGGM